MKPMHRIAGALILAVSLAGSSVVATAQTPEADTSDAEVRAQLAAITLDESNLPDGFVFEGETFLTADELAEDAEFSADDLSDAGFEGYYVSSYTDPTAGETIRSFVSTWTDEEAVQAGFDLLQNEVDVDEVTSETEAEVGSEPSQVISGTYEDETGQAVDAIDTRFTVDTFLVGVAVEDTSGAEANPELAASVSEELASRAENVAAGDWPENTGPELVAQILPVGELGAELQAGFLSPAEVEALYSLQGSALEAFEASWVEAVGVGEDGEEISTFVTAGLTSFDSADEASAVVDQAGDLAPPVQEATDLDVTIEGADNLYAVSFSSEVSEGEEADSARLVFNVDTIMVVIDVQGAADVETAADSATALADAQVEALTGDEEPVLPELPGLDS